VLQIMGRVVMGSLIEVRCGFCCAITIPRALKRFSHFFWGVLIRVCTDTQLNPIPFSTFCYFCSFFFYLVVFYVLSLLAVVMFMSSFKFRRKKCCFWPWLVKSINLNMLLEKEYFGIGFCW